MSVILEKLFGSPARVKLIRLFFLNPDTALTTKQIALRTHIKPALAGRELRLLMEIGFIRKGAVHLTFPIGSKGKVVRRKVSGYQFDPMFPISRELKNLMLSAAPVIKQDLVGKLRRVGRMKLVILAGIFIKDDNARIDMLIVGDTIKKGALDRVLKMLEADIGKELIYALMDTREFKYRLDMYDKFVRDILDYPHEVLIDKIGMR